MAAQAAFSRSAAAASLAAAGVARLTLVDTQTTTARALRDRLQQAWPALQVHLGEPDPAGCDLVVNATPLGMEPGDPLPLDVSRLEARTFVGEVVMRERITALLAAAPAETLPSGVKVTHTLVGTGANPKASDAVKVHYKGTLPDGKRTLILWRDCETLDYDALTKLCDRLAINPGDTEYDVVYVVDVEIRILQYPPYGIERPPE